MKEKRKILKRNSILNNKRGLIIKMKKIKI